MISKRQESKNAGEGWYFTGKPCTHGHIARRYTSNGVCETCGGLNANKWARDNRDKRKASVARWAKRNPEKKREASARFERDPANREKRLAYVRRRRAANPALFAANEAKRRAMLMQRLPAWADISSIKEFYRNRPEGHHVDHIIPLQGELVSGLHVVENMQYLLPSENSSKHNKYEIL